MNPKETNAFMEKIRTGLSHVKATLTHDYSWRDIASMKEWMTYPNTRDSRASAITSGLRNEPMTLGAVRRHQMLLTILLCIALFAIGSQLWLLPWTKTMQAQLELRPVQWAQLQHLVKVNQVSSATGLSASTMSISSTRIILVAPLDEFEMQKVRAVLAARDIKPNLLRLTNDNPPRIEFQANEVLFSAWIEVLNELRQAWHLYPDNISVIASATPGVVQVSSTLQQMNAPAPSLRQSLQQSSTPHFGLPKAP